MLLRRQEEARGDRKEADGAFGKATGRAYRSAFSAAIDTAETLMAFFAGR
ncbi:MAG: hypothetical protein JSR72_13600 [Proteobacteria bacterium]|nr:hypothetical protein [Pseudomonadota bacterium]